MAFLLYFSSISFSKLIVNIPSYLSLILYGIYSSNVYKLLGSLISNPLVLPAPLDSNSNAYTKSSNDNSAFPHGDTP